MDPIAILTGASSGIGAAAAQQFVERGYTVINISRRDCPVPGVETLATDLADEQSASQTCATLASRVADAGGAVGAALAATHLALKQPRTVRAGDGMHGSYLGPSYAQDDIERRLKAAGAVFDTLSQDDMIDCTARALAEGKAVGWHQGRMEFGPRALGGRSIIADPRSPSVQNRRW